jgi:LuxR family quorum-sensing transcriptional regulator LasR
MEDFTMASEDFHELIDSLSKAKTVEELHAACSTLCKRHGFDHFIYGAQLPTSFVKPYNVIISGYPEEWRACYTAENYQEIDPVVTHCYTHITPIHWEQIAAQEKRNHVIRRFMGEARESGLNSGISFPIHSSRGELSLLSVASE